MQARLIHMTGGAPVALALNGSVISVGQALGSAMGGAALATYGVPAIPATALSMSACGAADPGLRVPAGPRRRKPPRRP